MNMRAIAGTSVFQRRASKIDGFTVLLGGLGLLATALVLLREVNYGVGLTVDSVSYVGSARTLLEGEGFLSPDYPPFFPLALAFLGVFGIDAIAAAGHVNAVAFGLTVFTAAMWLRSRVSSRFLVIWGGLACALSLRLADLSAHAMTEPLFILFVVLALFALDRFLGTRKASFLLLAAACTALACLTRYVGVTVAASALLLLMSQRETTLSARMRNGVAYSVIALSPLSLWMLRNFLTTGSPTGRSYPTDFSFPYSLNVATSEIVRWAFGDVGLKYLNAGSAKIAGIAIGGASTVADVALKITILLVPVIAAGILLMRLNRTGVLSTQWRAWAVPAVFASVHMLFLAIILPLTDINLPPRYLAPMYVPALVAAIMVLNEFFCYAAQSNKLLAMPPRWNTGPITKRMAPVSAPTLILLASLLLRLSHQVYANYDHMEHWMYNGKGYSSKGWVESETVDHLETHSLDGLVYTTAWRKFELLPDIQSDHWKQLPRDGLDELKLRVANVRAIGIDVYFVWFHNRNYSIFYYANQYGLEELVEAFPAAETVAVLEDGVILKAAGESARPVVQSDFDVYFSRTPDRLVYARQRCSSGDTAAKFFLDIIPVDRADLPPHRRQYGFDNLDFSFTDYEFRAVGMCVAARGLPGYDIAEIRTGQYITADDGYDHIWEGAFRLEPVIGTPGLFDR